MLKVNSIQIAGNLTSDPLYREVQSGGAPTPLAKIRVAVAHPWKKDETYFLDCTGWRKAADLIMQFCQKGTLVHVSGFLTMQTWQDKDGNERITPEIEIDRIQFVDKLKPREEQGAAVEMPVGAPPPAAEDGSPPF